VSGGSDMVSDDEVPVLCMYAPFPLAISCYGGATSLSDSADKVPIPRLPPCLAITYLDEGR
jgi:hypothetical protein